MLARVGVPAGETLIQPEVPVVVVVLGHEDHPLAGQPMAIVGDSTMTASAQGLLLRVCETGFPIRPGVPVKAHVPLSGESRQGVYVPRSAIVRTQGRDWVYVQRDHETFVRREVALDAPTQQGWFVVHGLTSGEQVVAVGGQALLSEELESLIE